MSVLLQITAAVFITAALSGGIYFSFGLRFFQITKLGRIMRTSLAGSGSRLQSLRASATALAGAIGIGNITGVGTAIALGGPGAVLWIWVSAVLLMSVKYAEIFLSVRYQTKNAAGETVGGPMHYLAGAANKRATGAIYAALCFATAVLMGNMIQVNAVALSFEATFGVPKLITGAALAILACIVLTGGAERVTRLCGVLVPLFSLLYIGGSLYVIFANTAAIPAAFASIFTSALSPRAIAGGGAWAALRYGLARGVFTNEAGIGSSGILHAETPGADPCAEGCLGVFEVFFDTIVICTLTALPILIIAPAGEGALFAMSSFESAMPGVGGIFITVSVFFFAYATMIGWSFLGRRSLEYLRPGISKWCVNLPFAAAALSGSLLSVGVLWDAADVINAALLVVNMAGLFILRREVTFDINKNGSRSSRKKV